MLQCLQATLTDFVPPLLIPLQLEVLEPAALLLRQMPRFRGASEVDVAGRAFEDLSEFLHYRCDLTDRPIFWRTRAPQGTPRS